MKNTVFIVTLLLSASAFGQLQVVSVTNIADAGIQPKLSPNGKVVVIKDAGQPGLTCIDLNNGERHVVSHDGDITGDVVFSDGGTMVAYSASTYKDRIPYHTVKAANVRTGEVKELDAPAREQYAYRFSGGTMRIAKRTTVRSQRILTDIREISHSYILATEDDDLVLYDGKVRKVLSPNGENIYLWASISPDEKHIVYMAVNDGCHTFVCDMDGKNVVDLCHYIAAPTWFGNGWIIGQQDEDDGHRMTASRLVAIRIDGSDFQQLPTPQQSMPINPSASADGKVVFENNGQIFLMEVKGEK